MDTPTLDFYGKNASAITEKYREAGSGISLFFAEAFPWKHARILDIGCGSGRDLQTLCDAGHDAFGCEPVPEMRIEAVKAFPKLESRIFPYGLPFPEKIPPMGTFQGILCSAVFMHLSPNLIPPSINTMKTLLDHDGRILLSFPVNRSGLNQEFRDEGGRLFHPVDATNLSEHFHNSGFHTMKSWENRDSLGRENLVWQTMLFLCKKEKNGL